MFKAENPRMFTKEIHPTLYNDLINNPLVESAPSLPMIFPDTLKNVDPNGGLYYGTGLTTPKAMAIGLPFDVLGMIFTAEKIRRALGLRYVYHHIADTHAKTNDWIQPDAVDQRASEVIATLTKCGQNLGLDSLIVTLSSQFDTDPDYVSLVEKYREQSELHEYVVREMADMEWYRTKLGVIIKAGWIIQATETGLGFDERVFDREYLRLNGPKLSFVYTKPGRTLNPSRPKVSPYIQIEGEDRVLLDQNEDVAAKIAHAIEKTGDKSLGGAIKHLQSIVRVYEKLFGAFGQIPLEEKVQRIIVTATK